MPIYEGTEVRLTGTVKNVEADLTDTTITVTWQDPDGTETTPAVTHDSLGVYHSDKILSVNGLWRWKMAGTGAVNAVAAGEIKVKRTLL